MNNNAIAFTALSREFCSIVEDSMQLSVLKYTEQVLRLLPRIYISAFDLKTDIDYAVDDSEAWLEQSLTEAQYNSIRNNIAVLYGEYDVYLEVFEEDMKYSDTPVATSISENLADIYQALYDFLNAVKLATDDVADEALRAVRYSFREYWSSTLCNVLRALNHLWTSEVLGEGDDDM